MFEGIWSKLLDPPDAAVTRDKGAAFLSAASHIYGLTALSYFCMNIPRGATGTYVHYALSDRSAGQAITARPINPARLSRIGLFRRSPLLRADLNEIGAADEGERSLDDLAPIQSPATLIKLPCHKCELAILAYGDFASGDAATGDEQEELRILGSYFHGHMLRRNGGDTGEALIISARELDCLRWAAAGKSAWEASIILGISQRTVRFHLNSAREKLQCANTAHAVAKAVSQQLIAI